MSNVFSIMRTNDCQFSIHLQVHLSADGCNETDLPVARLT